MTVTVGTVSLPGENSYLPNGVTDVPRELLKGFPHSKKVGNYLLGKTLGEGSFAKVKEGLHVLTGEKVAVKVMDKKKAREDAYVRKNLRREGKLLSAVRHPNVVQLLEVMETENSYYLVTELCRGGDLMELICSKKRLDERTVKKYIKQILQAVQHLHALGILHRDLKVENLLLDENKNIKIIDFGLSNSVRVAQSPDGSNSMQEFCVTQCGSPAYAAPELLGNAKYGPKVDIWSIGVNMYAMLVGSLPFTVEPFNIKALHKKMLNGEINPIPAHLSTHCKDILKKFLNPDPNKRITIPDALRHPWISEGRTVSTETQNLNLTPDDLDPCILKHMSQNMGFRLSEIIRLVTSNMPHSATATYHLFQVRLDCYVAKSRVQGKIHASQSRVANSLEKRKSGVVTGKDLIELLPIDENLSDVNGNKDPVQHALILPNTVTPRKLPASRGEKRGVQRQLRNRYSRRTKDEPVNGDTTDEDRGDSTSRETSKEPGNTNTLDFRAPRSRQTPRKKPSKQPALHGRIDPFRNKLKLPAVNHMLDVPTDDDVSHQDPSSADDTQNNTPDPSQSNCTEASSSGGSKALHLTLPQRQKPHGKPGRRVTASDPTNGQRWKSATNTGPRVLRPGANQPVIDTSQYERFARKSSFNSTSNSLNSSTGSGSRPVRQLISLNYPAPPGLPSRFHTLDEDSFPTSPRNGRLASIKPETTRLSQPSNDSQKKSSYNPPQTAPSCSFQDSGFNDDLLLRSRNGVKGGSVNLPSISPPLTTKE